MEQSRSNSLISEYRTDRRVFADDFSDAGRKDDTVKMDGGGGNGLKRPLETDGETTRASGGGTAKTGAASTTSTGGAPKGLLSGNVKPKDNGSAKVGHGFRRLA